MNRTKLGILIVLGLIVVGVCGCSDSTVDPVTGPETATLVGKDGQKSGPSMLGTPVGGTRPIEPDDCSLAAWRFGAWTDLAMDTIETLEQGSDEWCEAVGEWLDSVSQLIVVLEKCEDEHYQHCIDYFYEWFELWWSEC